MRYLYAVMLAAALPLLAVADTQASPCEALILSGASPEVVAQQGCCQANKGVCGCRAGKIVCCDRTFSKDCGC
jgi:hypothetical protein